MQTPGHEVLFPGTSASSHAGSHRAAGASGAGVGAGRARDKDADRARAAVHSGEILPLSRILDTVSSQYAGDVIGVDLDRDDGVWQYEVKLLLPGGSVAKLKYDARTATLLRAKGRRLEDARRKP